MRRELQNIASEIDNFVNEVQQIKSVPDGDIGVNIKNKQIKEKEKQFKNYADKMFESAENKLNKQAEKAQNKLKKMQGDNYQKRQYYYTKANQELSNYKSPIDYLKDKKEISNNQIELQEARKVALSKAKATDDGDYQRLKEIVVDTMGSDELEARKELAKVKIKRKNLKGAVSSINFDLDQIKNGNVSSAKTSLIAFSETDNLEQKATKKISETL
ncbi:MAG TPA: hypothetical protein VKN64_08865 [Halanaerobiales bacterium]|nr:hypothetical protein [Halanaerobiales bacterium]